MTKDTTLTAIIASIRDRSIVAPEDVADALEAIDQRLRILEPCPARLGPVGGPHTWAPIGDPLRCLCCDLRRAS